MSCTVLIYVQYLWMYICSVTIAVISLLTTVLKSHTCWQRRFLQSFLLCVQDVVKTRLSDSFSVTVCCGKYSTVWHHTCWPGVQILGVVNYSVVYFVHSTSLVIVPPTYYSLLGRTLPSKYQAVLNILHLSPFFIILSTGTSCFISTACFEFSAESTFFFNVRIMYDYSTGIYSHTLFLPLLLSICLVCLCDLNLMSVKSSLYNNILMKGFDVCFLLSSIQNALWC